MDLYDQKASIRRHLYLLYQPRVDTAEMSLTLERVATLKRPLWRVERVNHRTVDHGAAMYEDVCLWVLTYYGVNQQDTERVISQFEVSLQQGGTDYSIWNLINGWRFGWQFPPSIALAKTDPSGTLSPGTYAIRVGAFDRCGNESAASATEAVVVTAPNNAIDITIPRIPWNDPVFNRYAVYVQGKRELLVDQPFDGAGYANPTVLSVLGTATEHPIEPSVDQAIRWKFLRVNSIATDAREDDVTDGAWQGMVTLETSVYQPRARTQADLMREITLYVGALV